MKKFQTFIFTLLFITCTAQYPESTKIINSTDYVWCVSNIYKVIAGQDLVEDGSEVTAIGNVEISDSDRLEGRDLYISLKNSIEIVEYPENTGLTNEGFNSTFIDKDKQLENPSQFITTLEVVKEVYESNRISNLKSQDGELEVLLQDFEVMSEVCKIWRDANE
tara:strand:+ start:70 stop:561 length:492 start_codon:yes stop_codon:yes gene_type:complete